MNIWRRSLCALLAVAILLSGVPFNVYATEDNDSFTVADDKPSESIDCAPQIDVQPVDIRCAQNETAILSLQATVAEGVEVTYQWYDNSEESTIMINGATESFYSAPTAEIGEKSYYCVITGSFDGATYTVQSNSAKVFVEGAEDIDENSVTPSDVDNTDYTPQITAQPVDVTCGKDEAATLTVSATAPEGAALTYQWYEVNGETGTAIDGATEASYTAPTAESGEKTYYCVVTNTVNGLTYTAQSGSAKVTVREAQETMAVVTDLKIIVGTYSVTTPSAYIDMLDGKFSREQTDYRDIVMTDVGSGFQIYLGLSEEIQAAGTVYYSLFYNDVLGTGNGDQGTRTVLSNGLTAPFQFNGSLISKGEETKLTLRVGNRDENGYSVYEDYNFYVSYIRGLGTLKVLENKKQVLSPTLPTGVNTFVNEFTGNIAAGTETVSVQIKPSSTLSTAYIGETAFTTSSYKADIALADYLSKDGTYAEIPVILKWDATNESLPTQTRTYTLRLNFVDYTPQITAQPVDVTCGKDEAATLTVSATAPEGAALTYQWYEVNGETGTAIDGATEASYTAPTAESGEKTYYCVVTNTVNGLTYTVTSNSVFVKVYEWSVTPPKILNQLENVICNLNDVVTLYAEIAEPESGLISYQWYKDGTNLMTDLDLVIVDTSEIGEHSYHYEVVWTLNNEIYKFKSNTAVVKVTDGEVVATNPTPVITKQPAEITCDKGDSPVLSVEYYVDESVRGTITYQWYKRGSNGLIIGATDRTFTPPTSSDRPFYYFCRIINTYNGVKYIAQSDMARVDVNLTYLNVPEIVRDFGSYGRSSPKSDDIIEYETEYAVGSVPNYIYFQFGDADRAVDFSYQIYHNTKNTIEDAELVKEATVNKIRTSSRDGASIYECYANLNRSYDVGEHYFFCKVTVSAKNEDIDTVDLLMGPVQITFKDTGIEFDGSGTENDPYKIQTLDDLVRLRTYVADGKSFKGFYFQVCNDITLPSDWTPIGCTKDGSTNIAQGTNLNAFSGIFDGKISETQNVKITVPVGGLPLFAYVNGATIKNLNIYGERIEGAGLVNCYTGVGLSGNAVTIEGVRLLSGTQTLKSGFIESVGGNGYAVASAGYVVTIRNCVIEEGVTIGYSGSENKIGSFAGRINGIIENCSSAATVKGSSYVGGILGSRDNAMSQCEVKNCTFSGSVEASGSFVGGIVGGGYDNQTAPNGASPTIVACTVTGTVKGNEYVGGIFGGDGYVAQTWDNVAGSISANTFTGTVSGNKYVGAIIGYLGSLNRYNNIAGNTFASGCGAETGIGFVKYLDTSYSGPTKMDGTIVLNTANGVKDCPEVEGCSWRADHNRTDDPLGKDADKLCQKVGGGSEPVCYELTVSGTYKTEYTVGDELNLTGIKLTASWTDGTTSEVALKDVTVEGYDKNKTGDQTVSLTYGAAKAYITVTVKPKSTKITVTVTVLGDSKHGDTTSPHGYARGGLKEWYKGTLEADTAETVWDVLQRTGLSFNADSSNQYGTVYIRSVNGLGEFDNGKNSGWMYTVNGSHPEVGVSARYLKDGDNIVLHYTDDYTYEEGGDNYGKPAESTTTAKDVIDLINKIGNVTYTDACKARIDAARKAYDALNAEEKAKVTNYKKLTDAEDQYKKLKEADDKAKAKAVDDLISKIGTVTINSGTAINAAWNGYNKLTAEQKELVTKLSTLQEATRKWNQLKADEVIKLIDKIEDPVTEKSNASIGAARKAYDALTKAQKDLVTNVKKLTDAETAYSKLTASEEDKKKAQEVIDKISKIGDVTKDSEQNIKAAREAYDALTDLQKKLVDNYDVLTAAETKLAMLKAMGKVSDPYITTGDYMEALGTPSVGAIGGEWMVIGLARSDRNVPGVEDYYKKVLEYVAENIDPETGRLHKAKSTDNSRIILALTAIGRDVTNVGGYDLLQGLSDLEFVKYQGNNGPIWALLALDSGNYPVPSGGTTTRQALIDEILSVQTSDGGWAISGDRADSDMTGMALTALAPYYKKDPTVKQAIDKAIARLSEMQDDDGGFSTTYGDGKYIATSESTAQVLTALSALGINADTDARFIKNGSSVVDALLRYYVSGGGFKHVMDGAIDGMGTEQAYYALTAYYRFLTGKTNLYDMTDVINRGGDPVEAEPTVPASTEPTEPEPAKTGFPWWIIVICIVGAYGLGVVTVTIIIPKFKKKG